MTKGYEMTKRSFIRKPFRFSVYVLYAFAVLHSIPVQSTESTEFREHKYTTTVAQLIRCFHSIHFNCSLLSLPLPFFLEADNATILVFNLRNIAMQESMNNRT